MGRLQAARWTGVRVLMVLDCCNLMKDLSSDDTIAAPELTARLGLRGLATEVIAAGYVDGSGRDGWEASAACCIAGIKAAWHKHQANVGTMAANVEEGARGCKESVEILKGFRCLQLGMKTAQLIP